MTHRQAAWKRALLALIAVCHWAIIPYALLAWAWPQPVWLIVHLTLIPALVIQWHFNDGVCVLNNLESWLRKGRWRDEEDAHQGRWIAAMLARYAGIRLDDRTVNRLIYGLLAVSWGVSLTRLIAPLG